jgi:hypothetical protein
MKSVSEARTLTTARNLTTARTLTTIHLCLTNSKSVAVRKKLF